MKRNSKVKNDIEMTSVSSESNTEPCIDETDLLTVAKLREILKPLIISMRCLGIVCGDLFQEESKNKMNSVKTYDNDVQLQSQGVDGFILQNQNTEQLAVQNTNAKALEDREKHFPKNDSVKNDARHINLQNSGGTRDEHFQFDNTDNSPNIAQISKLRPPLGRDFQGKHTEPEKNINCFAVIWTALGACMGIYIMISLIAWSVFFFYLTITSKGVFAIMKESIIFFWVFLTTCQVLTCLLTTYRSKSRPMSRFDKFVKAIRMVRLKDVSKPTKFIKMVVLIAWMTIICNALVAWFAVYSPDDSIRPKAQEVFFGGSDFVKNNSNIITNSWSLIHFFANICWVLPSVYYILLCYLVATCFDEHLEKVSAAILNAHEKKINLRDIRLEFVRLCHVLRALNDLLSPLGMVLFSIYIPLICVNINVCIQTFEQDAVITKVAYLFWITTNSAFLLMTAIAGAHVNDSVSWSISLKTTLRTIYLYRPY